EPGPAAQANRPAIRQAITPVGNEQLQSKRNYAAGTEATMRRAPAKTWDLTTCLGASLLLAELTGCAGDRYKPSTGHSSGDELTGERVENQNPGQIEDSRTAERVREALAAGADYKYDRVKVSAS